MKGRDAENKQNTYIETKGRLNTIKLKKVLFTAGASLVMMGTIFGSVISANAAVTSTQPQQAKKFRPSVETENQHLDPDLMAKVDLTPNQDNSLKNVEPPKIATAQSETSAETLTNNSGFEHRPEKLTNSSYKTVDSGLTDNGNVNSSQSSIRYTQSS